MLILCKPIFDSAPPGALSSWCQCSGYVGLQHTRSGPEGDSGAGRRPVRPGPTGGKPVPVGDRYGPDRPVGDRCRAKTGPGGGSEIGPTGAGRGPIRTGPVFTGGRYDPAGGTLPVTRFDPERGYHCTPAYPRPGRRSNRPVPVPIGDIYAARFSPPFLKHYAMGLTVPPFTFEGRFSFQIWIQHVKKP